jgi:hypothetical protein
MKSGGSGAGLLAFVIPTVLFIMLLIGQAKNGTDSYIPEAPIERVSVAHELVDEERKWRVEAERAAASKQAQLDRVKAELASLRARPTAKPTIVVQKVVERVEVVKIRRVANRHKVSKKSVAEFVSTNDVLHQRVLSKYVER